MTRTAQNLPTQGFFVDWNGDTRKVEAPGDGYSCQVKDCGDYIGVDVLDSEDFVTHEATYYPSIEAIEAIGCSVQLHASVKIKSAKILLRDRLSQSFDRSVQTSQEAAKSAVQMMASLESQNLLLRAPLER